jgi:hypothetical protein
MSTQNGKKLSTKNANLDPPAGSGGGVKPILEPGNYEITILRTELRKERDPKFGEKLIMLVESRPLVDFQGLLIDKSDPAKGRHQGRVGYVSYARYGFKDAVTPNDVQIVRDDEILRALGVLCRNIGLGMKDWWDAQDDKHDNVDQLYAAFERDKPYLGVWFHACIAGRQYMNGQYLNYELFFPRESRELGQAFHLNQDKVQKFIFSEHVVPLSDKDKEKGETAEKVSEKTPEPAKQQTAATPSATKTDENDPLDFLNVPAPEPGSFTSQIENDWASQQNNLNGGPDALSKTEEKKENGAAPWDL